MAWSLCGLALLYTIGAAVLGGYEVSALCRCAEQFPSSSDLNDTSFGFFNPSDAPGETWVFSPMSFHCQGHVTKITYRADYDDSCCCNCDCLDTDDVMSEDLPPQIQLWRKNDTTYSINRTIPLTEESQEVVVNWAFQEGDVMGLWIPSAANKSSCAAQQVLKVRYLYWSSRAYRISGYVDFFDTMDTELCNGPMPMISVDTDISFELECLIGGSVGVAVTLVALCVVCVVILYSANRTPKGRDGLLTINPENPREEERETELHMNDLQGEIPSVPNFDNEAVYEELPEHIHAPPQLPGLIIANQYTRPQSAASHHSHHRPSSPGSHSSSLQREHRPVPVPRQMSQSSTDTGRLNRTPSPSYHPNSVSSPDLSATPPPSSVPPPPPTYPPDSFDFNTTIQQLEEEASSLANLAAEVDNDKDERDAVEPIMFASNFSLKLRDSVITESRGYENVVVDHRKNSSSSSSSGSGTEYEDDENNSYDDEEDVYVN